MQIFQSHRVRDVIQLSRARRRSALRATLKKMRRFLEMLFTKQPELQVRLQHDPSGQTWWTTYNPVTGETRQFWSHTEMLGWIRDRYLSE
jgi:hypothetical protein